MKAPIIAIAAGLLAVSALARVAPVRAPPAASLVQHWRVFSDPQEGAFQLEMPQGWKDQGGTARRNALQYRPWAMATSPDGRTTILVNDPLEPSYVAPNRLLAMAGIGIGRVYSGGGGTTYIVEPYIGAQQYAAMWGRRKLAQQCADIRPTGGRRLADLAQRINAYSRAFGIMHDVGEATFTCSKAGQGMTAYVLVSTTIITGGIWYADDVLAFLTPTPTAGAAADVLAHMVKSVRANPAWVARQTGVAAQVSQIATRTNAEVSDSIMQSWESRNRTIDQVMAEGSRARLGVEIYQDPDTGARYSVSNTHAFYWVNPAGKVVGTDSDRRPGVDFRQLDLAHQH